MTRYGYIGLGSMGGAMVGHLLGTGAQVRVFDLDPDAVHTAVQRGAIATDSAAGVARQSDIVSICVPAAHHVEAVMSGPDGIAHGSHEGLTILVHSTVLPDTVRQARDLAASWHVPLHDACVAGGTANADEGTLTILAGGVDDMAPEVLTLLEVYGELVINGGPVGSGAAIKIAFNIMTYAQFTAAALAHDLVTSQGADPNAVFEGWRAVGQMGVLTDRFLPLVGLRSDAVQGDFRTMMETNAIIGQKDLALAIELGGTRPGANAVLAALRDIMPAVYGVADP